MWLNLRPGGIAPANHRSEETILDFISVVSLLGGLAMFLYGMNVMGDGLKSSSGQALKKLLEKVTASPILGMLVGTLVTAVIQSSTATIVLTVGLLGAGILTLRQSISIVLGANIGTTITAQIIRLMDIDSKGSTILSFFSPSFLAPLALIIGIVLLMFIKSQKVKGPGMMAMGFGLLFTGLLTMSASVRPLSQSQEFIDVLQKFSDVPILGIITGLVTTCIVQSSSAVIGIVQALSSTGVFTFKVIYPLVMGVNLGTCITTALVCSVGTSKDAKRTGIAHIIFNCVGTLIFMIGISILHAVGTLDAIWNSTMSSGDIANFSTIFNFVTAVILLPFTNLLVRATMLLVKDAKSDDEDYPEMRFLDENLFISPTIALEQVSLATARMGSLAEKNFEHSIEQLSDYSPEQSAKIAEREDRLDSFADASENYLVKLSNHITTDDDSNELNLLLQACTDFERIGDYAKTINDLAARLVNDGLQFSDTAKEELGIVTAALREIIHTTVEAFSTQDEALAKKIEPLEEVIDEIVATLKDRHIDRLKSGQCTIGAGLVFIEALTHMGRAADQCSSIAVFLIGRHHEEILSNHHAYLHELHMGQDAEYAAEFDRKREEYFKPIESI